MSHWYQKITKTKFDTIQVKILSQIGPKIHENGEKCRKANLYLSQFFSFLRPFKATKQLLGVCKMARGVTLVPNNVQDIILVQYKSKY